MSDDINITIDPAILNDIEVIEKIVDGREIETESDEADAARMVQMVKERFKTLEDERTRHTRPLLDKKKKIDKLFKRHLNRLSGMKKKLEEGVWRSIQARQERNREAMQAAQLAAQSGGNVGAHLDAIDDRPLPPSTTVRQHWQYTITDPGKVPPHLWSPDPHKIAAELAKHTDFNNPPHISGIEIMVGGGVTVRASRKK